MELLSPEASGFLKIIMIDINYIVNNVTVFFLLLLEFNYSSVLMLRLNRIQEHHLCTNVKLKLKILFLVLIYTYNMKRPLP